MKKQYLFKWKHYQPDIILLTVRWYLRYNLSFRDLVEVMEERGLSIAHTTIMRWVHRYGPELDERVRRHLNNTITQSRLSRFLPYPVRFGSSVVFDQRILQVHM